eukprot:jgi/Bigna1/133625/aug1.22_g8333
MRSCTLSLPFAAVVLTLLDVGGLVKGNDDFMQALGGLFGECKQFRCKKGSLPVMTEDGWNLWANGCGAMGIQVSSGEFNFTRCCDFHDVCYGICGMKMKICEDRFSQCLNNVCGAYGSEQKDSCLQTANTFKMGTKLLGCQLFQESQNSNCQCVAKDTVQQKRKEDLDNLLHKYGDSRDGSALMGEKKSTNKYAKLVADVIEAHYPDSIEIRDPRRQRGKETDEATISDSPHKATEDEL